jgi:hypothetical protein
MALTKLPKNAFGTGSVDDSKIEDGTIQNQELAGSLSEDKLATGTIENASLSNSSITINGTSISLGGSSSVGVDVNWQSVVTADGSTTTTGVAGNGYFIDTTSAAHTFNLPASATLGDQIAIKDYAGTFGSNNLTIGRNGHNIQGVANDSLISTNRASLLLVYVDSTKGWIYAEESNVADLQGPTFISATGGTITTSGDYKIHTFTGDGCFVVASIGNCAAPAPQRDKVDYLVIAGGGSGGFFYGGGGGAGGYREGKQACGSPHTASPLAATTGLPVTATTYPITVGAGGAAPTATPSSPVANDPGSPSIFSTITSAGGGRGGGGNPSVVPGGDGGSGGGGGKSGPAGSGNTPPTSPSQGNPGGSPVPHPACQARGGGGGAATAGGQQVSTFVGGIGGDGTGTGINPSCTVGVPGPDGSLRYFAGGGSTSGQPSTGIAGVLSDTNAVANTGGGAGDAAAGGKGIVIIRYKFQ